MLRGMCVSEINPFIVFGVVSYPPVSVSSLAFYSLVTQGFSSCLKYSVCTAHSTQRSVNSITRDSIKH